MSESDLMFHRIVAGCGLFAMIFFAWCLSHHKSKFPVRVVVGGLAIQLALVLLILKTTRGRDLFSWLGDTFTKLLDFVDEGCVIVFGDNFREFYFAFKVLPTIVFFSALMAVLYHLRVMQFVVKALAWVLQSTLKISGAESLSAAANIFVGQTEAPFVIRPYIPTMTKSELTAIMTGGFATVAGGVLALYVGWGIDAGHLITASFISAPAGLLIAKVIYPETETPVTADGANADIPVETSNVIEAATSGASDGLKLALNVAAMLIAFTALIAMCDYLLSSLTLWAGNRLFGMGLESGLSLSLIFGYLFAPLGWLMGIEWKECLQAGELLGLKMIANELIAYDRMREMLPGAETGVALSARTVTIMTYALSGFSSFASIGIQVGGIGGLCPERRKDLAELGLKAMLGGTLACCMTACIAGIMIENEPPAEPTSITWNELPEEKLEALESVDELTVVNLCVENDIVAYRGWKALEESTVLPKVLNSHNAVTFKVRATSPEGQALQDRLKAEGRETLLPALLIYVPGAKIHPVVQISGDLSEEYFEFAIQAAVNLALNAEQGRRYEINLDDDEIKATCLPVEPIMKEFQLDLESGQWKQFSSSAADD